MGDSVESCLGFSWRKTGKLNYKYMYLKRYAKFTFCIKSSGHVSDENSWYTVCT